MNNRLFKLLRSKKYYASIILLTLVMLILSACGSTQPSAVESSHESSKPTSDNNIALPTDKNTPEYWISKIQDSDKVIQSQDAINRFNSQTLAFFNDGSWTSGFYDINQLGDQVSVDFIRNHIQFNTLRNSQVFYKGAPITDTKWQEYEEIIGLKELEQKSGSETCPITWAVTVDYADVLDLPTKDILTDSTMDQRDNYLQQTLLAANEPLAVLLDSSDGQWSLIFANEYYGWIRKESYACFSNKNDYNAYFANNFLTITSDKTSVFSNGYTLDLRLGTKLYLQGDTVETAILPIRGENGKLKKLESVNVKGEFVSGNLELTSKNLIKLAFSMLGDKYEWGGSNKGRDCSSYMKDIYACFGIRIPRNTRDQERIPGATNLVDIVGYDAKKAALLKAKPGDLFGIQGHVMMYLGEDNGRLYVINMLGGVIPEDVRNDFISHIIDVRTCMLVSLDVHRGNGNTWTEEIMAMINLDKIE